MLIWILLGIIVFCLIIIVILSYRLKALERKYTFVKYNYENKILDMLSDIKQIENRYATSGTAMCKYLDNAIAYHNKSYHHYKNKLNIDTLSENV